MKKLSLTSRTWRSREENIRKNLVIHVYCHFRLCKRQTIDLNIHPITLLDLTVYQCIIITNVSYLYHLVPPEQSHFNFAFNEKRNVLAENKLAGSQASMLTYGEPNTLICFKQRTPPSGWSLVFHHLPLKPPALTFLGMKLQLSKPPYILTSSQLNIDCKKM